MNTPDFSLPSTELVLEIVEALLADVGVIAVVVGVDVVTVLLCDGLT